ncbi:MAG: YHS domain-containing (seleno)protein [Rhizobiaceae bacterium]
MTRNVRNAAAMIAALFVSALLATQAFAGALNLNSSGVAIQGYDPVAYFTENKPVKGSGVHVATHDGAIYWFSSADNQKAFKANPAKYVPAYGGFCAYGVAQGVKVKIDPTAFKIVDGQLYLNITHQIQKTWEKDIPGYISKADSNWKSLGS